MKYYYIDRKYIENIVCNGNLTIACQLMQLSESEIRYLLSVIRDDRSSISRIRKACHRVKPTFYYLGNMQLSELIEKLLSNEGEKDDQTTRKLIVQIGKTALLIQKEVRLYIQRYCDSLL